MDELDNLATLQFQITLYTAKRCISALSPHHPTHSFFLTRGDQVGNFIHCSGPNSADFNAAAVFQLQLGGSKKCMHYKWIGGFHKGRPQKFRIF